MTAAQTFAGQEPVACRDIGVAAVLSHARRVSMTAKGYARTTLTDLAKAAKMSVSHLLYYDPSKEPVLLELSILLNEKLLVNVRAHHEEPPQERIHVIVDNVFTREVVNSKRIGIAS